MTGCWQDQFDDDPTDPDLWRDQRRDDYAADDYLNNRLAHEADDKRKQTKESGR